MSGMKSPMISKLMDHGEGANVARLGVVKHKRSVATNATVYVR